MNNVKSHKLIKCPICLNFKFWDFKFWEKNNESSSTYVQCQKCWSIINIDEFKKTFKKNILICNNKKYGIVKRLDS